MSRVLAAIQRAEQEGRAALVCYLCAGDPSLDETPDLLAAAAEAGADILEVGVPFSDPTADGPVIQRASERALRAGTTLTGVLEAVRRLRERSAVPVVLFGYYNPILRYGEAQLVADAQASGVDGFLVVDLPPEEAEVLAAPARAAGLDYVPLLAPTSTEGRARVAAKLASSFIYYVSLTGVTGAAAPDLSAAAERAGRLSTELGRPVAVGFGVRDRAGVAQVAAHAQAVVVGSALVRAQAEAKTPSGRVDALRRLVADLRAGTRRPG